MMVVRFRSSKHRKWVHSILQFNFLIKGKQHLYKLTLKPNCKCAYTKVIVSLDGERKDVI